MTTQIRYQVFVSSTYQDLREERQQATQAILEAGFFPSGMELFPASDDAQWELIKQVIQECDYYVIIVGARYGDLGPGGMSYTEMEYDYAVEKGIPVLGFVRENIGQVLFCKTEQTEEGRRKLDAFRAKVMTRTCRKYSSPPELGMAVMKSLMTETRLRPRTGWVRADQARSERDLQRERKLVKELDEARELIESLEREIRDRAILGDKIPVEDLAQGDDAHGLTVTYTDANKKMVTRDVALTWDEIFRVIAPTIYGYVVRKRDQYGKLPTYPFQDHLEDHLRAKIIDEVQNRKLTMEPSQLDVCILQFKELGLLQFAENKKDDGNVFRGVTLTEEGERRLTLLSTRLRPNGAPKPRLAPRNKQRSAADAVLEPANG